jgi:hypothetical protein
MGDATTGRHRRRRKRESRVEEVDSRVVASVGRQAVQCLREDVLQHHRFRVDIYCSVDTPIGPSLASNCDSNWLRKAANCAWPAGQTVSCEGERV